MTVEKKIFNPFPGLRPFNPKEGEYFFGRTNQIRKAIEKVIKQRFVALIGSSGSGKSSLINAGILPGLSHISDINDNSGWKSITTRPGASPVDNLARSIAESRSKSSASDNIDIQSGKIAAILRNNSYGLTEALQQEQTNETDKILLVIDQFEDLFRFKRSRNNKTNIHEFDIFIKLIIEAQKQQEVPVFIILAIRSDFLDECQAFKELNHLINDSNFILPQLTTEDMLEVMNKPAVLAGGELDLRLQQRLLNDIRDKADQLPLLQHILNRMWEHWLRQKDYEKPVSLINYEAVGMVENALTIHADEAFEELSNSGRLVCERMFKALTEKGTENHEITIPTQISELSFITRVSAAEIIQIVERFRQHDRAFLMPDPGTELTSETMIDLAHESLMRQWSRLQGWIEEESRSVIMYQRLAEASRLYQIGKTELWSNPELEQALLWQEKNEPTFQWAQRYNTAFERTMQFLNRSKEEQYLREAEEKDTSFRKLRNTRIFAGFLVLLLLVAAFTVLYMSGQLPGTNGQSELTTQVTRSDRDQTARIDDIIREVEQTVTDTPASIPPDQISEPPARIADAESGNSNIPDRAITSQQSSRPTPPQNLQPSPVTRTPQAAEPRTESRTESPGQPAVEPSQPVEADPRQEEADQGGESYTRAMISVSQTLAIRSLQLDGDSDLKALLALQSHVFNEKYNGMAFNADIYAGLFTSVRSLYGNTYNVYKGHLESVNSVVFRPNSTIFYSASSDGNILQWDLDDETRTPRVLIQNQVVINKLAISPNGQWLAAATDGQGIKVFNPARNQLTPIQLEWGNNRIIALDFYPDNDHVVFAGSDNSIVKFNVRTNSHEVIAKTDSEVLSISVSPTGRLIAAGTRSGQVILFREDATPAQQIIQNDQGNNVLTVRFNRNGSRIAAGSTNGEVRLLEVATGNLLATLRGHSARVADIGFCPNNAFIATTSFDGTVQLWNYNNLNATPVVLRDHGSWVRTVSFNSDGTRMVTGSRQESRLIVWTTNSNEMAAMICEKVSRSITRDEWSRYIGDDIPYMEPCSQLSNR